MLTNPFMLLLVLIGLLLFYSFAKKDFRILGSLVGCLGLLFVAAGGNLGIPVVFNNQQLGWLSTSQALPVWRLGFLSLGDAPPLLFRATNSNCVSNSGNGDGGSEVKPDTGGGCWLAVFPASGIDPAQFGAPTNNTGDASIGINRAINYIRSTGVSNARFASGLNFGGSERRYRLVASGINLTCLSDRTNASGCAVYQESGIFNITSTGAQIYCYTTGKPCMDGLGSEFVTVSGGSLAVTGDCGSFTPSYGLQMGRTTPLKDAGFWTINNLRLDGCYTKAAYYNGGGEVTAVSVPFWLNNYGSGTSYGAIIDADNHWNITSDFVAVTLPVDVPNSFDQITIQDGSIGAAGGSSTSNAIWVSGTNRFTLERMFLRSNNGKCMTIWNDGVNASSWPHAMVIHAHCEYDIALVNWFYFTSKNATSTILSEGLDFEDYDNRAATAIFSKDTNTVSIQLLAEKLKIINYVGTPALFDTPSAYTITNPGTDYISSSVVGWSPSPSCTGLGTGGSCALRYGTPGAGSIRMTTGTGSPGGFGNITLSFGMNLGLNKATCQWTLVTPGDAGATFWSAPGAGVITQGISPSAPIFQWQNSGLSPLAVSSHVDLDYICRGL